MNGINLLDGWFQFPVGNAAFYAIFGFMFVFLGITLLIVILTCLGKGMDAWRGRKRKQPKADKETAALPEATQEEGVSPQVIAAITAAIAAYTEEQASKCDFVVKRIRKI